MLALSKTQRKPDKDQLTLNLKDTELLMSDRAKRQLVAADKARKAAAAQKKHVYKNGCTIEEVEDEETDERGEFGIASETWCVWCSSLEVQSPQQTCHLYNRNVKLPTQGVGPVRTTLLCCTQSDMCQSVT